LSFASRASGQNLWVTAYYAGWRQKQLSPADIDYTALTHVVHFGVLPRPDGTIDEKTNLLGHDHVTAAVAAAHGAGRKILSRVGGRSSRTRFLGAIRDAHRADFIANLVEFLTQNGYDGIDVDMEKLEPTDAAAYERFIRELRRRLDKIEPRPILTAAALWEPVVFAELAEEFDQINLMAYNLSGAYPGWVTWHSGAIYDGGYRFPNGKASLPSVSGLVEAFLAAGVPKGKLGVGFSFYGYVWTGPISAPGQTWTVAPVVKDMPYFKLADAYAIREYDYTNPVYRWDPKVQAAYLSIKATGSSEGRFISYDNEVAVRKKVEYAREKGLGGVMIWELGGGFRVAQPQGRRDLLLQAVKEAAFVTDSHQPVP
jgi:chitinase